MALNDSDNDDDSDELWYWLPASWFCWYHYPETSSPVTESIGFQPKPLRWLSAYFYPCEERFWLEASTLSNRGEMRQHLPTDYGHGPYGWLEASTSLSNDMSWYWLPASWLCWCHYPETSSPVTQSIGFQPKPLLIIPETTATQSIGFQPKPLLIIPETTATQSIGFQPKP